MRKSKSVVIYLTISFLVFHLCRDFMQLIGLNNFITDIYHNQGIADTNKILAIIGLKYKRWTEIPMIIIEISLVKILLKYQKKQKFIFSRY